MSCRCVWWVYVAFWYVYNVCRTYHCRVRNIVYTVDLYRGYPRSFVGDGQRFSDRNAACNDAVSRYGDGFFFFLSAFSHPVVDRSLVTAGLGSIIYRRRLKSTILTYDLHNIYIHRNNNICYHIEMSLFSVRLVYVVYAVL